MRKKQEKIINIESKKQILEKAQIKKKKQENYRKQQQNKA